MVDALKITKRLRRITLLGADMILIFEDTLSRDTSKSISTAISENVGQTAHEGPIARIGIINPWDNR